MKKLIFFILSVFACVLSCTSEETNMNTMLQNYTFTASVPKTYFSAAEKKGTVQLIELKLLARQSPKKHMSIFHTGITQKTQQ